MRPHKACRAAGLAHGIVRMTQSRRQVVRSKFLHQCADTAPGKPPFIAAAARVFVKVRQPFHVRPFWHGQNKCAKQGTVDDIHLKAVRLFKLRQPVSDFPVPGLHLLRYSPGCVCAETENLCQLPPNRYPRTHGAVSSPEMVRYFKATCSTRGSFNGVIPCRAERSPMTTARGFPITR